MVAASINEHRHVIKLNPVYRPKTWIHMILQLLLIISQQKGVWSVSSIKNLPGFPGPLPFKLETGYVGLGENEDVQLFYYFMESEGNPKEDPLVLWLNGGPGCSALSGLAIEIGPIRFNIVEYNGSLPTWVLNPHSWTKASSVIFLDAPVGSGFSYSTSLQGSKTGDKSFVHQCHEFLRKWLISRPEFITNPLYISGDSYVGLIIPLLVQEISEGVEAGHEPPFNLKGYMLGNALTDPWYDANSRVQYAYHMGLISEELYKSTKRSCNGNYVHVDEGNAQCAKDLQAVSQCTKQINNYNILASECTTIFGMLNEMQTDRRYLQENYVESLLSLPQLPVVGCRNYVDILCNIWANDNSAQEALHVRPGTVRVWDRCNRGIDYVREVESTVEHHRNLTTKGFRALIYSGDHDMAVPYLGTLAWIKSLDFPIVEDWQPWFVEGQVAGYSRVYANGLTFATIKGAGHTAPEDNPKESFALFKRWIFEEPL